MAHLHAGYGNAGIWKARILAATAQTPRPERKQSAENAPLVLLRETATVAIIVTVGQEENTLAYKGNARGSTFPHR